MFLHFLGRGAGFADEHTSAYFVTDKRDFFLLDCPSSAFLKVKKLDLSNYENFYVLITHTHGDHIGGLGLWIQYCFFVLKKKATVLAPSKEVMKDLKTLLTIEGNEADWYNLLALDSFNDYLHYDCIYIAPIPTKHSPQLDGKCFGYYVEVSYYHEDNTSDDYFFIYTGDTSTLEPYEDFLDFCSEMYVDVSVYYGQIHLKLEEALNNLKKIAESDIKVYLMHLDDVAAAEKMIAGLPGVEVVPFS